MRFPLRTKIIASTSAIVIILVILGIYISSRETAFNQFKEINRSLQTSSDSKYNGMNDVGAYGGHANPEASSNTVLYDTAYTSAPSESKAAFADQKNKPAQNIAKKAELSPSIKLIVTGMIQMESTKYDDTIRDIQKYTTDNKGYISSSEIQGASIRSGNRSDERMATLTIKIPKGTHDNFISGLKNLGQITSQKIDTQDITSEYFDTDTRVASLKIQETRLLDLLKRAEKMADIITIEDKLRDVRQQIEGMTGQMKRWDNQVEYTTLTLTVREVIRLQDVSSKKDSLGSRLAINLKSSMISLKNITENLLIVIAFMLPFIVVIGIVLLLSFFIRRLMRRKDSNSDTDTDTVTDKDKE